MSEPTVRVARPDDGAGVAAIYAPFVRDTATTFEAEPPGAGEMARRIEATLRTHPYLVAAAGDDILGYAYATAHRGRAAYRWCAEVSVYIAAAARRRGVARALYERLFELLRRQRYVNAYAGISLPNPASVALHERLGFAHLGTYRAIGYKHGHWHDVGWWSLRLRDPEDPPRDPIAFAALDGVTIMGHNDLE